MSELTYITTCKGRLQHLKQTLPTVVAQPGVDCVVVDYSCPDRAGDWVEATFPKVKVVRVEGQAAFNAARARNAGARAATSPWLGFFDADISWDAGFSRTVLPQLKAGHFYRAMPVTFQSWGSVICARADFDAVGGYDETYDGWGGEDDDFLGMLQACGRRVAPFPAALLGEIAHTNELRSRHHDIKDIFVQQCINHTYMYVKFDVLRLFSRPMGESDRKALYEKIRRTVLEMEAKNRAAPGFVEVQVPAAVIRGRPDDQTGARPEATLQRKLVYTLKLPPRG